MVINPYEKYKKAQVETANQGKLILMLYDGAIRFLNLALVALSKRILDQANNNIIRAQDIIWELLGSLDMERGGEIAANLFKLYDYMNRRLILANIKKDPAPVTEIINILQQLREAWAVVFKESTTCGIRENSPLSNLPVNGGQISFER
ncbi:MAG: flagellar export chaperone FliS [Candidatus Hydrogenedentota bacterium]